jgi:hypothetical protein
VDIVKAASYYVHFGLTTSSEVEKQATGRVRPKGQRFAMHISRLHYKTEGIDPLTLFSQLTRPHREER